MKTLFGIFSSCAWQQDEVNKMYFYFEKVWLVLNMKDERSGDKAMYR